MAKRAAGGRGCAKSGCFGCLGAAGLLVIVAGGIALIALLMGPPPQEFVDPGIARMLPVPAGEPASIAPDRGTRLPGGELRPHGPPPGRIDLRLSGGEFEIVAGEPGSPVTVGGRYNAGAFEITEELREQEDGGWTYLLRFRRSVSWMRMLHGDQHEGNHVRITLPRGVAFTLVGDVGTGLSRWELGGLWLVGADLRIGTGDHRLAFDEPTPEPMGRFELEARMGEFDFSGLGNASPSAITIRGGMGEMRLDLRGQWRNDTEVAGRWRMGPLDVRVPRDVKVEADNNTVFMGAADLSGLRGLPDPGEGVPTMRLDLAVSMGELVVRP